MTKFEKIKEILLVENEEFREIARKHRELDEEIEKLTKKRYLTSEEELKEAELKKQKLMLKDKMLKFIEEYRKMHPEV